MMIEGNRIRSNTKHAVDTQTQKKSKEAITQKNKPGEFTKVILKIGFLQIY